MKKEKVKKIVLTGLFYYASFLSLLVFIVGLWSANNWRDYLNIFLFAPIFIFVILNYKNFYKIK